MLAAFHSGSLENRALSHGSSCSLPDCRLGFFLNYGRKSGSYAYPTGVGGSELYPMGFGGMHCIPSGKLIRSAGMGGQRFWARR
jgi:hypothetical protein